MIRKIALLLILTVTVSIGFAQDKNIKWRNAYLNFGYVNTTMTQEGLELKSDLGASFSSGRTFYLHKPIANRLRIGIDLTWFDLTYSNYKIEETGEDDEDIQYHQAEAAMHIGPSLTFRPFGKFNIHGYFRFAPSFSALYVDETFYSNYASFFVGGASISYGIIGFGIEKRYGNCKYNEFSIIDLEDNNSMDKVKYSGWRAYLTFRF